MALTPEEMIELIETAMRNGIGVKQVTADGTTVVYDHENLQAQLIYWKKVAAASGNRRRSPFKSINLGSAW